LTDISFNIKYMANTYTQIYLQLVFSPLGHTNAIPVKHKAELQKYTTGIIRNRKHKLLASITRRNIIRQQHSGKNTLNCLSNLILIMILITCLTGFDSNRPLPWSSVSLTWHCFYKHAAPMALSLIDIDHCFMICTQFF